MNKNDINKMKKRFLNEYKKNLKEISNLTNKINSYKLHTSSFKIYLCLVFSLIAMISQMIFLNYNIIKPIMFISSIGIGTIGTWLVSKYQSLKDILKGKPYQDSQLEILNMTTNLEIEKEKLISRNEVLDTCINYLDECNKYIDNNISININNQDMKYNQDKINNYVEQKVLDIKFSSSKQKDIFKYIFILLYILMLYNLPSMFISINILDLCIPIISSLLLYTSYLHFNKRNEQIVYNKYNKNIDCQNDYNKLLEENVKYELSKSYNSIKKDDIIYNEEVNNLYLEKEKQLTKKKVL